MILGMLKHILSVMSNFRKNRRKVVSTKNGTHIDLLRKNKNKCSELHYNLTMIFEWGGK